MQKTIFDTGSIETDRKPQVSRNISSKDEQLFDDGDIFFARVLSIEALEPNFCISEILLRDPKDISDLFYRRKLDVRRCPVLGGRRLIPDNYLPDVEAALRAAGRLPEAAAAV